MSVAGELDMVTAGRLWSVLRPIVERGDHVVIDFDRLAFIGSSGVNVLVRAHNLSDANGAQLRLVRLPAQARRVLELSGLHDLLVTLVGSSDGNGPVVSDQEGGHEE
jgi:stage II sporulation protein AA (anti-sigma F factor antagonist)